MISGSGPIDRSRSRCWPGLLSQNPLSQH